jgi:hypothetical protein
VDREGKDILDVKGEMYPGCKARMSISVYGYDSNGNKGVGLGLTVLQKAGDGERLGGVDTKAAAAAMGALPEDGIDASEDPWADDEAA